MLRFNFDNDFKFTIIPKLNGEPIGLSGLEDMKLVISNQCRNANFTPIWEITDVGIDIEVQKEMIKWTGVYTVFLTYRRPDGTYSDFFQDKKIGCPTFEIVPVGCNTDNDGEDVVIGVSPEYKGDKGDSAYQIAVENGFVGTEEEWLTSLKGETGDAFTYEMFTPDQIEELQKPATEAAESITLIENAVSENELARISSEQTRESNELSRASAENERDTAESSRATAEELRVTAENTRGENEGVRISNESGRVSAEEYREEKVSELWENITVLAQLPSFDITKKQRLVHEFGVLKWEDYE